jgi:hypothetical protein
MARVIFRYGIIAGLIVAIPWLIYLPTVPANAKVEDMGSYVMGYAIILVALSLVFLGIKHYRDKALGGVIRFGRGFGIGLGISTIASVLYVAGWEVASWMSDFNFAQAWANSMVEEARARGADAAGIARASAEAAEFQRMYANPMVRMPMVFSEIFPVGILVSLISAAVLRNSRILPARMTA